MKHDSPQDLALRGFGALSHPGRLRLFRLVMRRMPQTTRPGDVLATLDLRPNTLSGYFADLVAAGLLTVTRQGRELHYRININGMSQIVDFLVTDCCQGRPELCTAISQDAPPIPSAPYSVLFLCRGNAARSLMAEAILNAEGAGRFRAYSAGTQPGTGPHPEALALLRRRGYDTAPLRSKPLTAFQGPKAPRFDFVFTVCARAAAEDYPPWAGVPLCAHWPVDDPVTVEGSAATRALAFSQAFEVLHRRISLLIALSPDTLNRVGLQHRLDQISHQ